MNTGTGVLALLALVLTVGFGKAGIDGLEGRRIWLPTEGSVAPPTLDEVPSRYRRRVGAVFLVLACVFLVVAIRILTRPWF